MPDTQVDPQNNPSSTPSYSPGSIPDDPRDGNDALCFTPGFPGASFGAGTIHAYLAADREPPKVVAGISLGTLSAAVIQRSYSDLGKAKKKPAVSASELEAWRWKFFRKYLATMTDRPFQVLWNGIPDPADFFAELPPIKDPVPETITDPRLREEWKKQELASREELYLLVKLGHWLAKLPIRVSAIANTLVTYVRAREKYPSPSIFRWLRYILWQVSIVISLVLHILRVPARFPRYKFKAWREKPDLPDPLCETRERIMTFLEVPNWTALFLRFPFVFAVSAGPSPLAAWAFYRWMSDKSSLTGIACLVLAVLSGAIAISISTVWLFIKAKRAIHLVGRLLFPVSIMLLLFLPWSLDHTYLPMDVRLGIFWGILSSVLCAYVLLVLSAKYSFILKFWIHVCSAIASVLQKPLFGLRVYSFSALTIAILQLFAANVSIFLLAHIDDRPSWTIIIWSAGAIVSLFFTTSLGTWWVPMKGKFPFRIVPLVCSAASVVLLGVLLHVSWLRYLSENWILNHVSAYSTIIQFGEAAQPWLYRPLLFSLLVFSLAVIGVTVFFVRPLRNGLIKFLLKKVAMEKHVIHDYHLKHAITQLFGENAESPVLADKPFPAVLVATPLQSIGTEPTLNNQLWANTKSSPLIVDVLRATLAVPGILDPLTVKENDVKTWYRSGDGVTSLDLVDAAIVRQNPLPAFFNFIRRNYQDHENLQSKQPASSESKQESKPIADSLESTSPSQARVHVIYNVPAQPPDVDNKKLDKVPVQPSRGDYSEKKLDNIIDVAFLSLRLAKRRDINLEIDQTNFIARLARQTKDLLADLPPAARDELKQQKPEDPIFPIFADHIAPESDLSFANPIAPQRDEVLRHAAAGCRATLQQLYSDQINAIDSRNGVECRAFLSALRKKKDPGFNGHAGLPEICQHCDKHLRASKDSGKKAVFDDTEVKDWRQRKDLNEKFPQLTPKQPRIVFVASGGVFRGPFHAGMVNAMLALNVKPDLIVGASVGTLVGAALAATLAAPTHGDSLKILGSLVEAFQHSDDQIAFTKTLKNAARELGIRGRNVDLAPFELRKKILEGTKADPGFAVTGTPPILIDAISDILLIPHRDTSDIAAQFVAGHFTDAMRLLLGGLRKETLRRLEIRNAVMGASLLEPTARRLLGSMIGYNMSVSQPYNQQGIAIFGTSTNLNLEQPVLLGRYKFERDSYDFVNACLASSAFPAVFAPRREDEIFAGLGDPEQTFSDGGMFDNLPISPALEILTASQRSWIHSSGENAIDQLGKRVLNPDLFITGSLDISASPRETTFDNLVAINKRAKTLQNNVKIKAFEEVSERISAHLGYLHNIADRAARAGRIKIDREYLNGLVNAVLLPVYPTNAQHLNGTFQFCNSLGRKPKVIDRSIADGCFQTMKELAATAAQDNNSTRARAVRHLAEKQRVPVLAYTASPAVQKASNSSGHLCSFFVKQENGKNLSFSCPFSEDAGTFSIFRRCVHDRDHKHEHAHLIQINRQSSTVPPPVQAAGK